MKAREVTKRVSLVGAIDWNRRLFDDLIPLPDGTSYNSYLVYGSEKTALIDATDPAMWRHLEVPLRDVKKIDYIVSQHAEQDHSGTLPQVLALYPEAVILCSSKAKPMLIDHLHIDEARIQVVADGEKISLGDRTLQFVYTPWVHWPETMCTLLPEEKILFTCDFFGSHFATSRIYAGHEPAVLLAAARYYAEIMMPFRAAIKGNLKKLDGLSYNLIAPSHGPLYDNPDLIVDAYRNWVSDDVSNRVVIPYISMHGSTELMVDHLIDELAVRQIEALKFNLTVADLGQLAMALMDAATIVIGTPTVHLHSHPAVTYAATVANAIRPKTRHVAVLNSYGWATKVVEELTGLIPNLKAEVLGAVLTKGMPRAADFAEIDKLADTIHDKHVALGLL